MSSLWAFKNELTEGKCPAPALAPVELPVSISCYRYYYFIPSTNIY